MAANEPVAVGELADRRRRRVVLIGDLADDLLDDVLGGDDARRCAHTRRSTSASSVRSRWRSASRSSSGFVSGTIGASRTSAVEAGASAAGHHQLDELVDVDDALDAVRVVVLGDDQARVAGRHARGERLADDLGQSTVTTAGIGVIT